VRIGHNPARFVEKVTQPAEITVTVVNCIPFLSGYYEQSLEVLKACINSIHENTPEPHDLMVFDNHSCREVRDYLKEAYEQGIIQYLVLSDKNIGKIGAWNFMFGAAQGKYVVFSDGDIAFRPGWLKASLELFETFPNVGMVTARPYRASQRYSEATFEWAQQQGPGVLAEGMFLDWETVFEHASSIGVIEAKAREDYSKGRDYRLTYHGKTAYIGASHFQFMARGDLLRKVLPLPSEQPMRGERRLDIAVNKMGGLRLTTEKPLVLHMGNRLPELTQTIGPKPKQKTLLQRILWLPGIRHFLLWLNNRIFQLYFFNVE
jgi:glycosyltransferase involved in cell wall biosynthesis